MKTVVLCINVPELDQGGYSNPEVCKKYPGSGWMPYLDSYLALAGMNLVSGYQAKNLILQKSLDPKDLIVIQEELNADGKYLIELGAQAGILFCLESPLYTPFFYDAIPDLITQFQFQILFQGGTHPTRFPSFDLNDIRDPEPTDKRSRSCMVVSNKYYKFYEELFSKSPTWHDAIESQLHDARYVLIQKMEMDKTFDLYGNGWPESRAKSIPPGKKVQVIRDYLVCYCFENIYMHGYLTEKLFDCLIAGVAPVYLGAPDIDTLVPSNVMLTKDNPDADLVIQNGQKFIRSKEAIPYSYQGFSETMLNLLKKIRDESRSNHRNQATRHKTQQNNLSPKLH